MNIYEKLTQVQNELKVPKNQYNNFGKYSYRSCEDIQMAVKSMLKEHKLAQYIKDEVIEVGNRVYIKAIVTLINTEKPEERIEVSAMAKEDENKKGMDGSQLTGSCSSYARKYALSGLYSLDDTKDVDGMNNGNNEQNQARNNTNNSNGNKLSEAQHKMLKGLYAKDKDVFTTVSETLDIDVSKVGELSKKKASELIKNIKEVEEQIKE